MAINSAMRGASENGCGFFFWCMPSQHSVVQIHHNRHVLFIVRATVSHINSVSFVDFYLFSAVLHHTAHVQFCCLSSRLGDRASARQTYGDGRQPTKTESERRNCAQHNIAIYLFEALIARTAHNGKSNGEKKKRMHYFAVLHSVDAFAHCIRLWQQEKLQPTKSIPPSGQH